MKNEKNAEEMLRELLIKIEKQQQIISEISSLPFIDKGEVEKLSVHITETASHATGVERAGVWLFNEEETTLQCIDLYEVSPRRHSSGYILSEHEFSSEFSYLKSSKYIASDDPLTDPRTRGYVEDYLKPLHITSMLDSVIKYSGKNLGVICFEHVNRSHRWGQDEISFACQLSDQMAFAISNRERNMAEESLKESEKKYRRLFEDAVLGIFQSTPEGKIININPACASMFGYNSPEELMGMVKNVAEDIYAEPSKRHNIVKMIIESKEPVRVENIYKKKDGSTFTGNLHVWAVWDERGNFQYLEGFVEDITERRLAEDVLRESEERNRFISENAGDVIWILDFKKDRFKYVSPSVFRLRGFTHEEVMKQSLKEVFTEESFRFVSSNLPGMIDDFLSSNSPSRLMTYELDQRCKDGSIVNTEIVVTFSRDNHGQITDIIGITRDITSRKRMEEELRKKTEELERFFSCALDLLCIADTDGYFHRLNHEWEKTLGYSIKELEGQKFLDFVHPDDMADTIKAITDLSEKKNILNFVNRYRAKDGTYRWIDWKSYPAGNLIYAAARDITERKEMEEALKIEKSRLETASMAGKVGLWVWHIETGIIEWTGAIDSMLGYNLKNLSGNISLWENIIHRDDRERVMISLNNHLKENTRYKIDYRVRKKDGTYLWWHVTGSSQRDSKGKAIKMSGACVDITERKMAEEELMKTRALFEAALEQSPVGIMIADAPDVQIHMINNAAGNITGVSYEEQMDISVSKSDGILWNLLYLDGRKYEILEFPLVRSILNGEFVKDELMLIKRPDGSTRYIMVNSAPIFNDFGDIIAGICIFPDVTEARKAEEERLEMEKKLLHAQKLESLGIMAGGIAHDFNNLLMALLGNLELARMDISPFSPAVTYIDGALQASRRAADLTRQMLAYSGKGRFVITDINISELVEENYHLFKASLAKSAILKLEVSKNLPAMEGDPGQIQQIIMNLITNASEAIGDREGVITLATGLENCRQSYLVKSRLDEIPQAGRFVYIDIRDTGCGMDKETQDKLFDPFFTTKFTGRGLGMSAVMGIVKSHRGAIIVDSIKDRGTSIKVLFPASQYYTKETDSNDEYQATVSLKSMHGTILLVDDEDIIVDTSKIILQRLGFQVITASDGEKAIEVFREHSGNIDCIIMDMSMPKMDGMTAFKKIIHINPGVKVILSSGYNEEESVKKETGGLAGFLEKPYQIEELQEVLKKTLGK